MRFATALRGIGAGWLALAAVCQTATAQSVVDLPIGGGGSERVLYLPAAQPRATVILLTGGDGVLQIGGDGSVSPEGNFLVRTRSFWAANGISAMVLASPNGESLFGRRHLPEYAAALAAAVDYARQNGAPVWLIGTSMGTIAAVNGGAHLPGRIAGIVLTSSITRPNRAAGETVFDSDPSAVAVPALVMSNTGDTCVASPPGDGPRLLEGLAASPRKDFVTVSSSEIRSDPCEASSPHGYLGIEGEALQRIAGWIR